MSISATSLFDLAIVTSDLALNSVADLQNSQNLQLFYNTMHLFDMARSSDKTCNLTQVDMLFRQFGKDVCLLDNYIDQLANKFYLCKDPIFNYNINLVSSMLATVQRILRRIDMQKLSLYAPWRFTLFLWMAQIVNLIDERISRSQMLIYKNSMASCGGVDFCQELQIFCEIVQQIRCSQNHFKYPQHTQEKLQFLRELLSSKLRNDRSTPETASLSRSSSEDEEDEEEDDLPECEKMQQGTIIFDDGDPVATLLSLSSTLISEEKSENLFKDFSIPIFLPKVEKDQFAKSVDDPIWSNKESVETTYVEKKLETASSSAKAEIWRSPSLEAAKEKERLAKEAKKARRFPYRKRKKSSLSIVVSLVDTGDEDKTSSAATTLLPAPPSTITVPPKIVLEKSATVAAAATATNVSPSSLPSKNASPKGRTRNKKVVETLAVSLPAESPPTALPPPTASASIIIPIGEKTSPPAKKKKKGSYNQMWVRK